jgi:hypothetical protein
MSAVQAVEAKSYTCSRTDFATCNVVGGSERAVKAANDMLKDFAKDFGLGEAREKAINTEDAKTKAALFSKATGNAGLNFANVDGGFKNAPSVAGDKGSNLEKSSGAAIG